MMAEGRSSGEKGKNLIKVTVKFCGKSNSIDLSEDSTIKHLKDLLLPLTDVLPRGQKLICGGKVLEDGKTLRLSGVKNGSKIMLVGSQGLHQGNRPFNKEITWYDDNETRPEVDRDKKPIAVTKDQFQRWMKTGVLGLAYCNLVVIPDEVWKCGGTVKLLDLSHNFISDVPPLIGTLTPLEKLMLSNNRLTDDYVSWEALCGLKSLIALSLSHNLLKSLPSALGYLTSLKQLHVANNELTCLPTEIGLLSNLQVLKAQSNRIVMVPPTIGSCISLFDIDLSSNLLADLPETFSQLTNLKSLYLNNNGLKSLPATLLIMCTNLSTLELHSTQITIDLLRQFEGWESFDERRRLKLQKQLDSKTGRSTICDEGADKS